MVYQKKKAGDISFLKSPGGLTYLLELLFQQSYDGAYRFSPRCALMMTG
ncbi:hypothetical protein [Paenibacillus agricola]|uniref:Uncharacterized protein n=1 Tax=Paenibacillus agricola TaxID=2716264 RepID=A0ABX0J2S1_9BACL|nr:hypothetical protein [Paenibacillus agricola]NHN29113.1 hypothetical protein [Paenibacillus agricola]